jgi:hypothetical protein
LQVNCGSTLSQSRTPFSRNSTATIRRSFPSLKRRRRKRRKTRRKTRRRTRKRTTRRRRRRKRTRNRKRRKRTRNSLSD